MSARGAATRERLLAAALALIPEVGWSAVTTRAVAERAGVRSGLVHYHFPTVPDLLTAAALAFCRSFGDTWLTLLDDATDPDDGIARLIAQLDAHPPDDPANRLMAEIYLAAPRHPDLRTGLSDLVATLRARLTDWLRAHGSPDPHARAALVLVAVEGIALHRAIGAAAETDLYIRALTSTNT
ncbi:TetR/AcrR family transcriptional regulator [Actinokineospora sp. UTMC 2448]|uniref:TetR/AcrR family transcriptional regulator n=1 Tax=Actinokineospora sp. UTMC 2448 TaxID=2268449 RepID=UPI002164B396|nr:TetR/AcrR family transcriptional regulator [Actinokineospora sp. UTMC 2448]UVS82268.1 transcriptional regulator BetI [Actinokineospora sp. UTMC 2448]